MRDWFDMWAKVQYTVSPEQKRQQEKHRIEEKYKKGELFKEEYIKMLDALEATPYVNSSIPKSKPSKWDTLVEDIQFEMI